MKYTTTNFLRKGTTLFLLATEVANAITTRRLPSVPVGGLRGGALSVDDEGNFFSPPSRAATESRIEDGDEFTAKSSCSLAKTGDLVGDSSFPTFVRGGVISTKNDRFGDLFVDDDGNFYSAASPPTMNAIASVRGGDLCVDVEGNFYSPRTATATPFSSCDAGRRLSKAVGRRGEAADRQNDPQQRQPIDKVLLASKITMKKKQTETRDGAQFLENELESKKKHPSAGVKPSVEGAAFVHK